MKFLIPKYIRSAFPNENKNIDIRSLIFSMFSRRFSKDLDILTRKFLDPSDVIRFQGKSDTEITSIIGQKKYLLNWKKYVLRDIDRLLFLGLHLEDHQKVVLDLGCGSGYFCYLVNLIGHCSYGIEPYLPNNEISEMYLELANLFGINRLEHFIKPCESIPFPADWEPIDIVTANQICFNRQGRDDREKNLQFDERFEFHDWNFLFKDLLSKSNDNITIDLHFNKPDSWVDWHSPSLISYFKGLNAYINGSRVLIKNLSNTRESCMPSNDN